tara:strand:+ start:569 stop:874 length:306 start_codon:yes stop_codon:yes gene_type:complete
MGAPHVTESILLIAIAASFTYAPPWWCLLPAVLVVVSPHAVNVWTTALALTAGTLTFAVALWAVCTFQDYADNAVVFATLAALSANPHFAHASQCAKAKRI